ncbi:hypothetical protein [Beduinella massiliensis]|uniref:hypothetical protein n=1 Tax=Beduinella massiliensis TaxID=1852363 RepID=UPI0011AFC5ED
MTKKNVAALMLAGAMMTVGSGAMAAESATISDTTTGSAEVGATYTSAEKIDITVSWNTPEAFAFTWKNGAWIYEGEAKEVTFKATNAGSKDKNVALAASSEDNPNLAWITATPITVNGANPNVERGTTDAQPVAGFNLMVDNKKLPDITENSNDPVNASIKFDVTISDVSVE